MRDRILSAAIAGWLATGTLFYFAASAQTPGRAPAIAQAVDESKLVTLRGNVRPEANSSNDRGLVDENLPLDHLLLQLQRSPETELAVQKFLDSLHDPQSPNFHKWLTAAQFGERFGTVAQDLDTVTRWLASHGFVVNQIHPNGMLIDFSGTAGQVRNAFHTEIHNLEVNGISHIGNMSDPQIPAALAPVVAGVVSLHDFRPHAMRVPRANYTSGATLQPVVPGDLATIYNFNQAYASGYTGAGQTVVVIEDSDFYSTADFTTFRSTFGLTSQFPSGSMTQVHPTGGAGGTCTDPGANDDDAEAEIDAEWASAAAPNAAIVLASCADTRTNFGGFIALQNLLAESTLPSIVSISYGESEAANGAAGNLYIYDLYQTAVAEGVSLFVSAGDQGAASSDGGSASATHGITVSAFATTPYNVAVGGTDFADTYKGTNSSYWSSTNGQYYNSALSYIPEIPWNNSCASQLLATYWGFSTTYGASGFCASSTARSDGFLTTVAASGGPSNCATGRPSQSGIAGGTCAGYPKPSWQSLYGNPADGVRDIPDISLFAANGVWGHYYVTCFSDPGSGRGGSPCTGAPDTWAGYGGTSFASPVMAGIQALINQKMGAPQGNPNYQFYSLAQAEYGSSGNSACSSASSAGTCTFNDVTLGDMDVNCTANSPDCFDPASASNGGVLSTSTSSYAPAFGAARGWDFATGIGTLNVYRLITNWTTPPGTTPQTITFNALNSVTYGVAPFSISATATSGLAVSFASTTTAVCTVTGGTVTILAGGTCSITASQPGNTKYAAAPSVIQSFTVNPASQTISFSGLNNVTLGVSPFSITATASSGLTVSFASTTTLVCTVTATGATVTILSAGTCSITASQAGNADYSAAAPVVQSFVVNPASQAGIPAVPLLTAPTNGATGVTTTPTLTWNAAAGAISYNVYFGTSPSPPLVTNISGSNYTPGTLSAGVTYYWQIVAVNSAGSAASVIWSFVTASGSACSYQLGAAGASVSQVARTTSVAVTAGSGCAWSAASNNSWLTITSGNSGNGSGGVSYSIAANPNAAARTGSLTIAGKTFTVAQTGTTSFSVGIFKNGVWVLPTGTFNFGLPGDLPVVGDWTGTGTPKIGVFRPSTQIWYLDANGDGVYEAGTDITGQFGVPGDLPVVGDWNGSGKTQIGIFRPSVGLWALDMNGNASWDASDVYGYFGLPGDTPVVGDWTGTGTTKVGIFRSSNGVWALDIDGNLAWDPPTDTWGSFGFPNDEPVVGDWTNSGVTRVGIFRPSVGLWALDVAGNLAWDPPTDTHGDFGFVNDVPIVGDWQGIGRTQVGIYRPSVALWALDIDGNLTWTVPPDTDGYIGPVESTPVVARWP